MKKLWKHEWKYHIFFVVMVSAMLILSCDMGEWIKYDWFDTDKVVAIVNQVDSVSEYIVTNFLDSIIWPVLIGLLVKKSIIYWIEKNACGREFFQSLPIRRKERVRFHFLMDVLLIVVSVLVYACYEYFVVCSGLVSNRVEIPWLGSAYVGMAVVSISYLLLILGWLYFVECIWVNGAMKLVSFLGSLLMIYLIVYCLFSQFEESRIMQNIYGFFARESVAGNYYSLDETMGASSGLSYVWTHDILDAPFTYNGESIVAETLISSQEISGYSFETVSRLYDFTHPGTYIFHVIGYLVIGVFLVFLAYWLSSKQELSKGSLYFDFGRYVFGGMIAVTFYMLVCGTQDYLWQRIMNIAAAVIIFILLLYLLNPDRKHCFKRKVRTSQLSN